MWVFAIYQFCPLPLPSLRMDLNELYVKKPA